MKVLDDLEYNNTMKLNKVWIVRDPGPRSDVADVLFEMEMDRLVTDYVNGSPKGAWKFENHTVYDNYEEAYQDASSRLRKRNK